MVGVTLLVAVTVVGNFGSRTTHANPSEIFIINQNVGAQSLGLTPLAFEEAITGPAARRATILAQRESLTYQSGVQVGETNEVTAIAGHAYILVETDGSVSPLGLDGA